MLLFLRARPRQVSSGVDQNPLSSAAVFILVCVRVAVVADDATKPCMQMQGAVVKMDLHPFTNMSRKVECKEGAMKL